jgi:hypothetical protein
MTAPLNGQLLNGSVPFSTWAWGWARAEATATAEPVVNRVDSYARAVAVGEASSSGITDRLAFLNGSQQPFAETQIVATRYANVEGEAAASSTIALEATRYAWATPVPAVPETAYSEAYAERWKIVAAQETAWASSTLADEAITRIALVYNRHTPALARSWMAEARIDRIQVRQQHMRGTTVGRAKSRSIANSAIGRGRLYLAASISADNLRVNTYHAFSGACTGTVSSLVYPDRVRIIVGGMLGTAETRLAPTIERAGVRYSYNSSTAVLDASTSLAPTVIRRPSAVPIIATAAIPTSETYLVRGTRGQATAVATVELAPRVNAWHWMAGTGTCDATTLVDPTHYRWRRLAANSVATAAATGTFNHIRDVVFGSVEGRASTSVQVNAIRRVLSTSGQANAMSTAAFRGNRYVTSSRRANAALNIEAYGRRGRIMSGTTVAQANQYAEALRIVWAIGTPRNAVASTARLVFRINIDSMASDRRTIEMIPRNRMQTVPTSNREYRVT